MKLASKRSSLASAGQPAVSTGTASWFGLAALRRFSPALGKAAAVRRVAIATAAALLLAAFPLRAEQPPPPARDASTYPAFDAHATDHLTIAADPYDTPEKEKTFRIDYLKYNILPIRIIITNSGDQPISLQQVRIHFMPAIGDRVQAADPSDVERRVSTRDRVGSRIPIGPLSIHHGGGADNKIEQDFHEFEYAALVVEPHTTRAGFLFYDMEGLGQNPLRSAKLLVRRVQDANGKELFYFEIPFDKYLNAPK
jgi:hypothetical protein